MNIARPFLAVATVVSLASCTEPLTPLTRVYSELEASASDAVPGDTIHLRVIVTNRGDRQVVAIGCGPGFDIDV
ncbi:MAG: hypothetical protein Q8K82_11315 [Gemmatimonadaceae bacterium]|nr:hypothetical protein [Gemmatimonadaceae bacterium]